MSQRVSIICRVLGLLHELLPETWSLALKRFQVTLPWLLHGGTAAYPGDSLLKFKVISKLFLLLKGAHET